MNFIFFESFIFWLPAATCCRNLVIFLKFWKSGKLGPFFSQRFFVRAKKKPLIEANQILIKSDCAKILQINSNLIVRI